MRPAILILAALASAAASQAAVTVATVGDSLADAIYLGMKLQPGLLKKSGIDLIRWSRPSIGLTRVDYFDYNSYLRDSADLGSADVCIVELGANDLQSIAIEKRKWIAVGTDAWQRVYGERVQALVSTLKTQRCGSVLWFLQPANQTNKYLSHYHGMINQVQFAGAAPEVTAAFEILASPTDYISDGVHFNKDFCFKVARAVVDMIASWKPFGQASCSTCHSPANSLPATAQVPAPLLLRKP
ncbi:MAG TPA: hypothetical protein VGN17_21080 [Bryobacteraceae bacterium]